MLEQRPKNDDADFTFMCFWVVLVHSLSLVFTVYHPRDAGIAMVDRKAEKIDDIPSVHPSAAIHIFRDFSIHHKEWLVHANRRERRGGTVSISP